MSLSTRGMGLGGSKDLCFWNIIMHWNEKVHFRAERCKKYWLYQKMLQTKVHRIKFATKTVDAYLYLPQEWVSDFLRILQIFDIFQLFFIIIGNHHRLRPWNSWTANSDKKYIELNEAALTVNKPCVTSRKTAFPKDK